MIDTSLHWYGLRVRTGTELAVWEALGRACLAGFVPRHFVSRRTKGTRQAKVPRLTPLIPGYAFAGVLDVRELRHATELDEVYGILRANGEPARLCPRSLKQLQDMRPLDPVSRFIKGGLVTVIAGPLAGRRVRLQDFVAGKARIEHGPFKTVSIPLSHLEAA